MAETRRDQTEFYPANDGYNPVTRRPINGWVIAVDLGDDCCGWMYRSPDTPLVFGTKQDTQRAIDAMGAHGIVSLTDLDNRDRAEVVRICVEALLW